MTTAMTLESKAAFSTKQILCLALCCMFLLTVFLMGTSSIALCNGDSTSAAATAIEDAVNEMSNQIYKTMRSVITPITIIGFAWAGFQFLIGGAQGTEKARRILIGAVAGLVLVVFAPLFGQAVATWFASSGGGNLSEYNPL